MLQRAASNAYSWWWASNIRTKQSKWLDGNLQEMEEKVKNMIKLIEVDADSFAKKAEIYFRRRPELINFVEETYRSYKALADRYDRISGDLHKANHTLVSAFPDQFQLSMQEDDEDGSPKAFSAIDTSESRNVQAGDYQPINLCNRNTDPSSTVMKRQYEKINSNVTNESAANEIDRLQKEILVLQTEKEFVKSSYESGMAKFWEIEGQIAGLQEEVCALQDEFGIGTVIEDDEARALMAATAIKSCEESLVRLQQQKKKSSEEAIIESKRIREAKNRLQILKGENDAEEMKEMFDEETGRINDNEEFRFKNQGLDLNSICLQVKQHFQNKSQTSMVDLAEWVDELAEKVISMDVKVSSQTAQIQALRSETDQLHKHLQGLEEERVDLITGSVGLRQVEDELNRIQDLEKNVHDEKQMLETHFVEVYKSFVNISEKLHSLSHNERSNTSSSNVENLNKSGEVEKGKKVEDGGKDDAAQVNEVNHVEQVLPNADEVSSQLGYFYEKLKADQLGGMVSSLSKKDKPECRDEIPGWQEMKEQIQELKTVNSVKEKEIRALRMKLFSRAPSNGAASSQKKEGNEGIKLKADAPAETTGSEEGAKLCNLDQEHAASLIVEKFRAELDALLDENLGFWLRFSTSYHQIRKFEASFKEIQADLKMLKDSNKEGRSSPASPKHILKLDTRSRLDEKLRELHTELQVWLEQNGLLKGELQCRFKNLSQIEEEISRASRDTEGSKDYQLTPYQAAKFQGELLHMQHENNKVTKELQTGLDHAKGIQSEVANDLSNLRESLNLSSSNRHHRQCHSSRHVNTKSKVPLRTFLFGEKRKKQSFFSCISPAPNRHHQDPS